MKLVVGLGNPGEKYARTRHNAGMIFNDHFIGMMPKGVVVKNTGAFMNNSGEVIKKLVNYYNVSPEELYIAHDDLDIELGQYKIQKGKGPKTHNGIISIEGELETDSFWRIRLGVEAREAENKIKGEDYVLQDFSDEERISLNNAIVKASDELVQLMNDGKGV